MAQVPCEAQLKTARDLADALKRMRRIDSTIMVTQDGIIESYRRSEGAHIRMFTARTKADSMRISQLRRELSQEQKRPSLFLEGLATGLGAVPGILKKDFVLAGSGMVGGFLFTRIALHHNQRAREKRRGN